MSLYLINESVRGCHLVVHSDDTITQVIFRHFKISLDFPRKSGSQIIFGFLFSYSWKQ